MSVSYALRIALATLLCTCALHAKAAITCTLAATSVDLNYTNGAAAANASGTITVNCTRLSTDANSATYWVSIDYGSRTGLTRRVFRHAGGTINADRLDISIFKNATTTDWTNATTGRVTGPLTFGAALSTSAVLTYNFQVKPSQTGNTAGIYDETFITSLQLATAGPVVATATFTPTVSIIAQCFVGQVAAGNTAPGAISPSTLTLNYTSFSPTPQNSTMNFTVDCTRGTSYALALSPAAGTLLGLAYTLALSSASATGDGRAQPYTVTGTIAAGQAGTCSTATCTATQPGVTVTVTY